MRGGPGVAGRTLLSQASSERGEHFEGPEMNTATTFVDLAFTRLAIFQGGNSSEALPSTRRALKAISPQSSG